MFKWLGTAGFCIRLGNKIILIDPYLTRNEKARPVQDLRPEDMAGTDYIFVTHGHFDHLADTPAIMGVSSAVTYCSEVAAKTLEKRGVSPSRVVTLSGGESLELDGFGVSVSTSRHIVFDARLLLKTLPGVFREARRVLPELSRRPAGPVLIFSFDFGDLTVLNMGSLGLAVQQLRERRLAPPDILFVPVQGHTDICRRAAEVTRELGPRAVVPQHFDDFAPPISRMIDIEPFERMVREWLPDCVIYKPTINEEFRLADLLGGSAPYAAGGRSQCE